MDDDLFFAGACRLAALIRAGELSSAELTRGCLARIGRLDPGLRAFTMVLGGEATREADARDAALARGEEPGPLHGVPLAIKEEIDVVGQVTTYGGRANSTPARADAEVVRRLRAAGAVILGKTAMSEFGLWPFTESTTYGLTRNPWEPSRSPGGSSGGSAVAVASGMVPAAIGGDGGGSIRIPAACCGLFGLKPQRGRVTSAPREHLWPALSTSGPLTRSVVDSALVYDVIRGNMATDRFRANEPTASFTDAVARDAGRLRIGWSTKPATPGVRPAAEHVAAVRRSADLLDGLGHEVAEVDPAYPDPTAAFVPQFLGGVRAGAGRVEHPERLERRTRQALRLGAWARPRVVERSIRAGEKVAVKANRLFDAPSGWGHPPLDLLLTPSIAHRPPPLGALEGAGALEAALRSAPMIAYTALWNLTGNPAASVPAGFAADGLPLAVQLVGRPHDEPTILTLAAQLERAQPWASARPGQ